MHQDVFPSCPWSLCTCVMTVSAQLYYHMSRSRDTLAMSILPVQWAQMGKRKEDRDDDDRER